MKQIKQVEQFIKTCAWRNVLHELGFVSIDDTEKWAELFDAVTGDMSYEDLPEIVCDMYDYMGEVEELAKSLQEAYAIVLDTLRMLSAYEGGEYIMFAITNHYLD